MVTETWFQIMQRHADERVSALTSISENGGTLREAANILDVNYAMVRKLSANLGVKFRADRKGRDRKSKYFDLLTTSERLDFNTLTKHGYTVEDAIYTVGRADLVALL